MKQYGLLCLMVLLISGYYALESIPNSSNDWNGDPKICTVNLSNPIIHDTSQPIFPNQAEFTLETVKIEYKLDGTSSTELSINNYLYNYDTNKLVMTKNANGVRDIEFFYYETLKKSTYRRQICVVNDIDTNNEIDGTSAIQLQNGTWHLRPLNEFLLFSSNDSSRPIIQPKFIGQAIVRGIPVNKWETCIINASQRMTVRREWSFAQKGVSMPTGVVGDIAVPIHVIINASLLNPDDTTSAKIDEVCDIHSYRTSIMESHSQLVPPKGVFCGNSTEQNLTTLYDAGIEWPNRFSVRVEASSSFGTEWQRFHLRYDRSWGGNSRRVRYDYIPPGVENYETVIHDYGDNLVYIIDRRSGSCRINRGILFPEVSPIRDPIGFFIKNEHRFLFDSNETLWKSNGERPCRGDTTRCAVVTTSIDKFPAVVDPDTGSPSGETWDQTSIEYGWSIRSPNTRPPFAREKYYDYPVYLYLRMYRYDNPNDPLSSDIRTEDIEYEFYEMSHERNTFDFDTSICYRSLYLEYLHLVFTLKLSRNNVIDGNHLDRRVLERAIHYNLADKMEIRYSRVTDIEVDHERVDDDVTVVFTLLGPTPDPGSPTFVSNETTAEEARANLEEQINAGTFQFRMNLTDDASSSVQCQAVSGSLKSSKQFMSSHAGGKQVIEESYTPGSQAGAIVGGILVGLVIGILIAAVIRIVRNKPMPALPNLSNSISNPLPNISFHNKKTTNDTTTATDGYEA